MAQGDFKVKGFTAKGESSSWRKYGEWVVGKTDLLSLLKYELITFLFGNLAGALGLYCRGKLYPYLFGAVGKNVVFGRGIALRHPHKIRVGDNAVIDDHCMLDAKGGANKGIVIGKGVFIGRGSILCCKDGDIAIQDNVNISYNCELFSSRYLLIGRDSVIAAYCYLMSGGSYDHRRLDVTFAAQDGYAQGPTTIGEDCWLGAKVVVLDGVSIGERTVVGAGSVVTKNLPSHTVAVGVPARVVEVVRESADQMGRRCG